MAATKRNFILSSGIGLSADNIYTISSTNSTSIGSDAGFGGRFYNGRIAMVQIYNRALTAQEVLQNYNATKGRYR